MNDQIERDQEELRKFKGLNEWLSMCDLTRWEYEGLLDRQMGRCPICNKLLCGSTNLVDLRDGSKKLCRVLICPNCADKLEERTCIHSG